MQAKYRDSQTLMDLQEELEDIRDMLASEGEATRPLSEYLAEREERIPGHTVVQRLHALVQLYERGMVSALVDRMLQELLAYEIGLCQAQFDQLYSDFVKFEGRYGISSDEFYHRYQTGQIDDRQDYAKWASLVQMRDNLQERLRILTGEVKSAS